MTPEDRDELDNALREALRHSNTEWARCNTDIPRFLYLMWEQGYVVKKRER